MYTSLVAQTYRPSALHSLLNAEFPGHPESHESKRPEMYAGSDFLARLNLASVPRVCERHAQPLLCVRCTECDVAGALVSAGLCSACIDGHALMYPMHALERSAPGIAALRTKLQALVSGSSTIPDEIDEPATCGNDAKNNELTAADAAIETAYTSPIVKAARNRALAAQADIDALAALEDAAMAQLEENRDAAIAALQTGFSAGVDAIRSATVARRAGLQAALEAADAALEEAVDCTTALAEAVLVLDDVDLAFHAPCLSERFAAAQAQSSLPADPEQSVVRSVFTVEPFPGPTALRSAIAGLLGLKDVERRIEPQPLQVTQLDLTPEQESQLQLWLPPGGSCGPESWEEVYRATIHGFGAEVFHARCDGRTRLLILVRAQEGGWLFGGFTALGFRPPDGFHADPAAFLFSLTNSLGHPEKLDSQGTGMDLLYYPSHAAIFGPGSGAGLFVCSDADAEASSFTHTGNAYAESASAGAHPMARGRQSGWCAAEVVAWAV